MGAVVTFGKLGAVADHVFDEAARRIKDAAHADESAGATDDLAADDFAVAAAKSVDHAAVGDGLAHEGAEFFQRGGVERALALQHRRGGGEIGIGEGGHGRGKTEKLKG